MNDMTTTSATTIQYVPRDLQRLRSLITAFGFFGGLWKFLTTASRVELTTWEGKYLSSSQAAQELSQFSHIKVQEQLWRKQARSLRFLQVTFALLTALITTLLIAGGTAFLALGFAASVPALTAATVVRGRKYRKYRKAITPADDLRAELAKADGIIRDKIAERTLVADAALKYPWWYFSDSATPAVQEFMSEWEDLNHSNIELMDNMQIFEMATRWADLQSKIYEIDEAEVVNPLWTDKLQGHLRRYNKMLNRDVGNEFEQELSDDAGARLRELIGKGVNSYYKKTVA